MNWTRGLLRLWLVASVLWMAAALLVLDTFGTAGAYLGGRFLRTEIVASELSVSPVKDGVVTVAFEGRVYEIETGGVQPSDRDAWTRLLDAATLMMNQDAAINNARLRRARADALAGTGLAMLPPLFVLALGASLLWAVRGFVQGRKE